jgi:hypothetical protein
MSRGSAVDDAIRAAGVFLPCGESTPSRWAFGLQRLLNNSFWAGLRAERGEVTPLQNETASPTSTDVGG